MNKISIVTINFNNLNGLKKTFESVVNQSFENYEYIIIDGGSIDGSKEYIEQNIDKLDFFVSEPDNGIYHAMNKGIENSTGDYIYFLNSGDRFFDESVLEKCDEQMTQTPLIEMFVGKAIKYNTNNLIGFVEKYRFLDRIQCFDKMICHQSIFAKKHLFNLIGGFDQNYKIKADYDWILRVIEIKSNILVSDTIVCTYPLGGISDVKFNSIGLKERNEIRSKYFTKGEMFVYNIFLKSRLLNYFLSKKTSRNLLIKLFEKNKK